MDDPKVHLKSGSNLEKVLKAGHFAFTGECGPPKGANLEHLREKFHHLKGVVDAVNVTDNQTAVVRLSSWAASAIMVQEGVEPNFQMVCRDRNRLAMQSDICRVDRFSLLVDGYDSHELEHETPCRTRLLRIDAESPFFRHCRRPLSEPCWRYLRTRLLICIFTEMRTGLP